MLITYLDIAFEVNFDHEAIRSEGDIADVQLVHPGLKAEATGKAIFVELFFQGFSGFFEVVAQVEIQGFLQALAEGTL